MNPNFKKVLIKNVVIISDISKAKERVTLKFSVLNSTGNYIYQHIRLFSLNEDSEIFLESFDVKFDLYISIERSYANTLCNKINNIRNSSIHNSYRSSDIQQRHYKVDKIEPCF